MIWIGLIIGLFAGGLIAALASRVVVRRSVARARAAERRARSAERMAELGSMTGGLAHEIRNPLSTIGLNAQLLAEAIDELPIDQSERGRLTNRVDALRRESERLRGILEDFLEYAGEMRLDMKRGDLNEMVGELVDFFSPQAEAAGVRLRAETTPGRLECAFDAPHLKQAVLNLLLNAAAVLEGQGEPAPEMIIRTERGTDDDGSSVARLHVIDTGPGIDAQTRARIFRPYFTTRSGGTGLGLPTANRIAEAHGGRLDLHTEPGRGSDFTIVLPVGSGQAN